MALHPDFSEDPYQPLVPVQRWFPADESLREKGYATLIPPLVSKIREEVYQWRNNGYPGTSPTTKALLNWWFETPHFIEEKDGTTNQFRYYFAQREAVESVIWLYEVRKAREKFDLLRFDSSGAVSAGMFPETWPRYVTKMATGSGKTKVISLLMAWSYFHKTYEQDSTLSRNFLLIAPNIIVLDRLRTDFDGKKIFFQDPILPENGYEGRSWKDDFQVELHIQDDVRIQKKTGNIFLTNIHRVYLNEPKAPTLEDEDLSDFFLEPFGPKPVGKTNESRTDLGQIIREVDELAVFNDEAHHIHDERMGWFKNIQELHNRLLQKDQKLSIQVDVTATPKHDNGSIFVQTISDYPLVEAIHQNVVKHPVLPDAPSRARLQETKSAKFSEQYRDYLQLGIEEWKKSFAEHEPLGKKAILFVMVDDTKNCDDVGEALEKLCPELENSILVIHTKNNGEISETMTGKKEDELKELRKEANSIDKGESKYKAIVSVLMLKEGWDVRNVTTIVGLRAYTSKSNILPEQTLGRGLRRMYFGTKIPEKVSVMGTPAFMDFVESIQSEGVTFERRAMGAKVQHQDAMVIEVDKENKTKNLEKLDIPIPRMSRRYSMEFKNLEALDPAKLGNGKLSLLKFDVTDVREIVFKTMIDGEHDHTTILDGSGPADYSSVVGYFTRMLMKELRLFGGYDVLYGKVKIFMRDHLFENSPVNLEDPLVLRNLSEVAPGKLLFDTFKKGINALAVQDKGTSRLENFIRLKEMRPFRTETRNAVTAKKCIFNKVVGEPVGGGFELAFAAFLESASDVQAFAKNYFSVGFNVDYVKTDGELSTYTPDFLVRDDSGNVWIIETKGRRELDLPQKMARLKQWCRDATEACAENGGPIYNLLFVDQEGYNLHRPKNLGDIIKAFTEYR
jgi:type III restriction enzyme